VRYSLGRGKEMEACCKKERPNVKEKETSSSVVAKRRGREHPM